MNGVMRTLLEATGRAEEEAAEFIENLGKALEPDESDTITYTNRAARRARARAERKNS